MIDDDAGKVIDHDIAQQLTTMDSSREILLMSTSQMKQMSPLCSQLYLDIYENYNWIRVLIICILAGTSVYILEYTCHIYDTYIFTVIEQ